jgi:hypothetical protein
MDYDFDLTANCYFRWIERPDGTRIKLITRDDPSAVNARGVSTAVWKQAHLAVPTSAIAPTKAESIHNHIFKMLPTKKHAPRFQAGNYHPPRVEKSLRKKHIALEQAIALRNMHKNNNCIQTLPENGGPVYAKPLPGKDTQ